MRLMPFMIESRSRKPIALWYCCRARWSMMAAADAASRLSTAARDAVCCINEECYPDAAAASPCAEIATPSWRYDEPRRPAAATTPSTAVTVRTCTATCWGVSATYRGRRPIRRRILTLDGISSRNTIRTMGWTPANPDRAPCAPRTGDVLVLEPEESRRRTKRSLWAATCFYCTIFNLVRCV